MTSLVLNRLEEQQVAEIIVRVAGNKALPPKVMTEIVERTDGIPLYVEEMTKAVLEAKSEVATKELAVPASLHGSLMARLDRLGSAKEVAQVGAAIGREFSDALIGALACKPEAELGAALDSLVAAGLLLRQGVPPHSSYLFKHALVQDAAYETLLRDACDVRFTPASPKPSKNNSPILPKIGRSCSPNTVTVPDGPKRLRSIGVWEVQQAAHRGANVEAIEHFRRALLRNADRTESSERLRTELAVLSELGPALMSIHGGAAPAVGEVLERATDVAIQQRSIALILDSFLTSLRPFRYARGELNQSDAISDEIFRIARKLNDPELSLQAHHAAGPLRWVRGFYSDASEHFKVCSALYDEGHHAQHRYRYMGHDPAVCAMSVGASVKWALGCPAQAAELERDALLLARRLQHIPSLAHALSFNAQSQILRRDVAAVTASASELLPICKEHKLAQPGALAMVDLGWGAGRGRRSR